MAAITLIKFDSGFVSVDRGSLFDCPAEFLSKPQMAFYSASRPGWSRCPLGYLVYAAMDAIGRKFVVPAVYAIDDVAPKRKFPDIYKFSKRQIEQFLKPHLGVSEEVRQQRDQEFKNLTHDLRAKSTEIYHTALTARDYTVEKGLVQISEYITAVMNAQQMMSLRLDIVDYESGHAAGRPKEQISAFKKTEKVLHCFSNRMNNRNIRWRTEGRQFSMIYGPPIYDIIPFVVIENAIKYSPSHTELLVRFEETATDIITRFESLGPKIKDSEKERIFDQHFRGDAAKISERSGSGIGLFAARTLLETHFNGKIYVNQVGGPIWLNGATYFNTRFTVVTPINAGAERMAGFRRQRRAAGIGY